MSNLYISVWTDAAAVALGPVEQSLSVTIAGASAQSTAILRNNTLTKKRVRLFAEVACFVTWAADPTVTGGTDGVPLGAENPEYFEIDSGMKIAVIQR